jgi:hypothetical protein
MNPTLHWEAYQQVLETFRLLVTERKLIELIAVHKRIDKTTLAEATKIDDYMLTFTLNLLRRAELVLVSDRPAIVDNQVRTDEIAFYSINWKMIKAINKAISKL